LKIEYRYAKLDHEYDAVMADLVSRKVNVIVAANAAAASAAAKATHIIPIVLAGVNDPVGLGVADSLQRPGRNVSGTTIYAPHLIGERVRILKRIAPSLDRVAVFMNGNNKNNAAQVELLTAAAKEFAMQEYVLAGGLMALGVGHLEGYYGAAKYVDQMLRGESPTDLPIALPTTLSFSVAAWR